MPARVSIGERINALSRDWELLRPDGPGPHPLVVQLHGCGGKKSFQTTWGEVARDCGVAALVVDSHKPRGISQMAAYASVCTGVRLRGAERVGDLIAALEWARRQDWVDHNRLYAAGWSHGGWTILDALCMGDRVERCTGIHNAQPAPFAGVQGAFIVYPYAGPGVLAHLNPATFKPRITAIVCGKDMVVGSEWPLRTLRRLKAQGLDVRTEFFETGTHAFDEPEARDFRVRIDEQLIARGHKLYREFLRAA